MEENIQCKIEKNILFNKTRELKYKEDNKQILLELEQIQGIGQLFNDLKIEDKEETKTDKKEKKRNSNIIYSNIYFFKPKNQLKRKFQILTKEDKDNIAIYENNKYSKIRNRKLDNKDELDKMKPSQDYFFNNK